MMLQVWIQRLTVEGDKDGDPYLIGWCEVGTAPNVDDRWPASRDYQEGIVRLRRWSESVDRRYTLSITVEARRKPEVTP